MQNSLSGKADLSLSSMKAAARALAVNPDHPYRIERTVRAALRAQSPDPLKVCSRKMGRKDVVLNGRIIWLVGCIGSARNETSYALLRDAARSGYRVVTLTNWEQTKFRWAPEDIHLVDTVTDEQEQVADALQVALSDIVKPCVMVVTPDMRITDKSSGPRQKPSCRSSSASISGIP